MIHSFQKGAPMIISSKEKSPRLFFESMQNVCLNPNQSTNPPKPHFWFPYERMISRARRTSATHGKKFETTRTNTHLRSVL